MSAIGPSRPIAFWWPTVAFGACRTWLERRPAGPGREWPKSADVGRAEQYLLRPVISDVDLFRYCEGIIYLDPEVPDGAFDLGVAEQELHSS
jgi:hypothetical protein